MPNDSFIEPSLAPSALLDEARRLVPPIRDARDLGERQRQLAPPVLAAFHRARLFHMLVPADIGGLQVDPATAMEVVETVSAADGATGWNLMIGAAYGVWGSRPARDVARQVFGAPDAVLAGALRPTGTARAVEGGFIVDGRWSFASGIGHSRWWCAGCVVHDGDAPRKTAGGADDRRLVFFPAADGGALIDTWDTAGLRGTGSHDYAVKGLFVPAERTLPPDAPSRLAEPLYRLPVMGLMDSVMATVPVGIARAAIDAFVELAGGKQGHGLSTAQANRPTVQADVGRAEAVLRSARAWLYGTVEEAWAEVRAGREVAVKHTALMRLARANALTASVQAVDLMFTAAGGSAVYASHPIERCFRDVHVVAQHAALHPSNYEICGRVMLGLPPDRASL